MQVIYIDTIFAVNIIVNYFLLLGTAKVCGLKAHRGRLWLSAAFGAVYAVLCALPPTAWMSHAALKVLLGALMLPVAFGIRRLAAPRRLLRLALVFFALAMCAAGAVTAISLLGGGAPGPVRLRILVVAFGVCYVFSSLVFRRAAKSGRQRAEVRIEHNGNCITLAALVDTGNSLTDPLSGSRVCIVFVDDLSPLISIEVLDNLQAAVKSGSPDALIALNRLPSGMKFRLLPYSAVGVSGGMLICFRPERIFVNKRERRDLIVAVSPNEVADNITYSALI